MCDGRLFWEKSGRERRRRGGYFLGMGSGTESTSGKSCAGEYSVQLREVRLRTKKGGRWGGVLGQQSVYGVYFVQCVQCSVLGTVDRGQCILSVLRS